MMKNGMTCVENTAVGGGYFFTSSSMGLHFHDWIDYNGVAFSIELLEWGRTFSDFCGRQFFKFTDSKRTRMFVCR